MKINKPAKQNVVDFISDEKAHKTRTHREWERKKVKQTD